MSDLITINDIFDELKQENENLKNELSVFEKNNQILVNYRKLCSDLVQNCVCLQNIDYKNYFNCLEISYKTNINNNYQKINCNQENSEQQIVIKFLENNYKKYLKNKRNVENEDKIDLNESKAETNSDNESEVKITSNESLGKKLKTETNICGFNGCEKVLETDFDLKRHQIIHKEMKNNKSHDRKTKDEIQKAIESGNVWTQVLTDVNIKVYSQRSGNSYRRVGFGCNYTDCRFLTYKKFTIIRHLRTHNCFKPYNWDPMVCLWADCGQRFNTCDELKDHENKHREGLVKKIYKVIHKKINKNKSKVKTNSNNGNKVKITSNESSNNNKLITELNICRFNGCGKLFENNFDLKRHQIIHKPIRNTVNRKFRQTNSAIQKAIESGNVWTQVLTDVNIKVYSQRSANSYRRVGFECNYTDCRFLTYKKINLIKHLRIHNCIKPYNWDPMVCLWADCGQRFNACHELKSHENWHKKRSNKKPLLRLSHNDILNDINSGKTIAKYLKHDNIKVYMKNGQNSDKYKKVCYGCNTSECNYISFERISILIHMKRIHGIEKPFICRSNGCDQRFGDNKELLNHESVHGKHELIIHFRDLLLFAEPIDINANNTKEVINETVSEVNAVTNFGNIESHITDRDVDQFIEKIKVTQDEQMHVNGNADYQFTYDTSQFENHYAINALNESENQLINYTINDNEFVNNEEVIHALNQTSFDPKVVKMNDNYNEDSDEQDFIINNDSSEESSQ